MNAVVFIVDRREAYYSRAALHIAADPLDFYTRAERGRRYTGASLPTPTWQAPVLPSPRCPGGRQVNAADYSPGLDYEDELIEGFALKYGG